LKFRSVGTRIVFNWANRQDSSCHGGSNLLMNGNFFDCIDFEPNFYSSVFWDLYCAATPEKRDQFEPTNEAKVFQELVKIDKSNFYFKIKNLISQLRRQTS
jgi:hypothetical protein